MKKLAFSLILIGILITNCKEKQAQKEIRGIEIAVKAPDTLRIFTGLGHQLLSMSHGIEGFFIPPTHNTLPHSDKNINTINYDGLDGLLTLSAIAYIDGKPAGVVNETEIIYDYSKRSDANTMWLIRMKAEGYNGFIAVEQIENPANADADIMRELENARAKEKKLDKDFWLRTTSLKGATVKHATGDFEKFNGASFTEYSLVNLANPNKNGIILEFITNP